jgi:nucleoside-triphosphatase
VKKRVLLLTGAPGIGKTTVLLRTVEALKAKGYKVGGMVSREVRSEGERIGFEILDLSSGRRGWLAHVSQEIGPKLGKYRVNMSDLENIGANAVEVASESCDVVAVDEVGPMELFSDSFKDTVKRAVDSDKLVIGVVHWKTKNWLIHEVKKREDAEIFEVTKKNRDRLHESVAERASAFLQSEKETH